MRHLVIIAHFNEQSFNHAILHSYVESLQESGHEVRVRDLYKLDFDPVLRPNGGSVAGDVLEEQQHVSWAQAIAFIYPVWWTGLPAILKGYIDRVFSYGFAYRIVDGQLDGLLADKQVTIFSTTGNREEDYLQNGMFASMNQTTDDGIFRFCGVKEIAHKYFSDVHSLSDEQRKAMLAEVKAFAQETNSLSC